MKQIDFLRHVLEVLEQLGLPYMLVGSVSSGVYGEPRMTRDIDIVVRLSAGDVDKVITAFDPNDYYVSRDAILNAITHESQFNVIHPASGNKIDFIIARCDAWGKEQMKRHQKVRVLPDMEGYVAAPEDVIIGKMLYFQEGGSEKHLRDIVGILKISSDIIDLQYIANWTKILGLSGIWQTVVSRSEDHS
ncbi:MAG: hypothetical protein HYX78_11090 [Armatimonadetes bacterium]|nr:hypothetical protein [Armatimonadota bacterium]